VTPRTFTYTWTQTRLETIQDQFRYLMTYAGYRGKNIDRLVDGVGERSVAAVGVYACDRSGKRVIEVELRVDWARNAELSLTVPTISSGLSGWDDKQAPEIKVAGRRFAETVKQMSLTTGFWVEAVKEIREDATKRAAWRGQLNVTGQSPPAWKSPPEERNEGLLDLDEARIFMRRAGDGQ